MVMPQIFARDWHRSLFNQDLAQVWSLMTPDFRRVVAQAALGGNGRSADELDPIVDELAVAAPARSDLQQFYDVACSMLQVRCGISPDAVGAGMTTRVEAPSFEVVRLYVLEDLSIDMEGNHFLADGQTARALTLILSAEDDATWSMAGIGGVLAPGWSPTLVWEPSAEV